MKCQIKTCSNSKCEKKYPATLEYFCKRNRNEDGLSRRCKLCIQKYGKKHRRNNKKKISDGNKIRRQKLINRNEEEVPYPRKKKCSKCGKIKLANNFGKDKGILSGLKSKCKECEKKYQKKYHKDNEIIIKRQQKEWRRLNKYKRKIDGKKYYGINKGYICEQKKEYYQENREQIRKKQKENWQENKEKRNKHNRCRYWQNVKKEREKNRENYYKNWDKRKKYRQEHKEEINKYRREKRKTDLGFRIADNLRGRLNKSLRSQNIKKTKHTVELIGCSWGFLIKYLAAQFKNGMTRNNYGKNKNQWCIDHIKPCIAFDLTKEEEQRKCFRYSNLQPLWNKDNWSKSSRYKGKLIRSARARR